MGKYFGEELSQQHKVLSQIIRQADKWQQAQALFLDLHGQLHCGIVTGSSGNAVDALLGDLSETEYCIMPDNKAETIAWVLWHISRIEDMTMAVLVQEEHQLFDEKLRVKLNSPICDTANSLNDDEIMTLSKSLSIKDLLNYRNAVGKQTQSIVKQLKAEDLFRKVRAAGLELLRDSKAVSEDENSIWLLDYWGSKDVAGLLLMPPTRHLLMHLNDACRWKQQIRSGKKPFRSN